MSKSIIKLGSSLRLLFLIATLGSFLLSNDLSAQSRRALKKQAEELSYQQAGVSGSAAGQVNPNAMVVRSGSNPQSQLTPTQQMICDLTHSRTELQAEIDQLGEKLQKSRGSKARKITEELDVLANQISLIDLKLAALPNEQQIASNEAANGKRLNDLVDSLVDVKLEENGYVKGGAQDNMISSQVVYHVQLAVTSVPNLGAFSSMSGVEMQQRTDGKYAYYYGNYSSYSQAQSACRRVRANSRYRDAFVVALQGTRRISIQTAAQLIAQ